MDTSEDSSKGNFRNNEAINKNDFKDCESVTSKKINRDRIIFDEEMSFSKL